MVTTPSLLVLSTDRRSGAKLTLEQSTEFLLSSYQSQITYLTLSGLRLTRQM